MKHYLILGATALLLILSPSLSEAYTTSEQTATRINDTQAMFSITYSFGDQDEPVFMPVLAIRDLPHTSQQNELGFEILLEGEEQVDFGSAAGIVLGKVPIVDGMYRIPAGFRSTFTFVAFLTIPENTTELDYSLHIQELPFYVGEEKRPLALNRFELQHYTTPEVTLGDNGNIVTGPAMTLIATN